MVSLLHTWFSAATSHYQRRPPLILVNGLAEQPETWYRNLPAWRRHFDVHTPALLAYDGPALHRRIDAGLSIDVDYLVEQLRQYFETYVQTSSCYLLANSMGGKVAVEFAARYPQCVERLVLLCPSGLADQERLPIVEGVRRNDLRSVVESVFYNPAHVDPGVVSYYQSHIGNRRWRSGLLRTIRGTMDHRVRERLADVWCPTLVVIGRDDRIVDPKQSIAAAARLRDRHLVVLPRCGHAPQIECARRVNRLVVDYLTSSDPPRR